MGYMFEIRNFRRREDRSDLEVFEGFILILVDFGVFSDSIFFRWLKMNCVEGVCDEIQVCRVCEIYRAVRIGVLVLQVFKLDFCQCFGVDLILRGWFFILFKYIEVDVKIRRLARQIVIWKIGIYVCLICVCFFIKIKI